MKKKTDFTEFGSNSDPMEYGARWISGASSPQLERVTRQNGLISHWDIEFRPNLGGKAEDNPFDHIDLFAPELICDASGNVFRRFGRFYVCEQTIDEYDYIWVCKSPVNSSYRLPRAFYHKGRPHWTNVDIGVYEGGLETRNGIDYLTSKPGFTPAIKINRTEAFHAAKAWGIEHDIDEEQEFYSITTMSEITEILQPLLFIMLGTKNAHSIYKGVTKINTANFRPAKSEKVTDRILFSYDKYKEGKLVKQFPVGCCIWYENGASSDLNQATAYWHKVIASGNADIEGTNYYCITLDGPLKVNKSGRLWRGPNITGCTDDILATHGSMGNDGTFSFKVLGIENIYGNIWKHILDCTTAELRPYICTDLTIWEETNDPASSKVFKACDYTVCGCGRVKEVYHDAEYPDVKLPVALADGANTYYCDYVWTASFTNSVLYGGSYDDWTFYDEDTLSGLSCWLLCHNVGIKFLHISARLSHRTV